MLVVGGGAPEVDKLIDLQSIEVEPDPAEMAARFVSWSRSRAAGCQMARLISAAAAVTIPITEAVAAPVQKPFAQSSA